jgi:hypothetical protein
LKKCKYRAGDGWSAVTGACRYWEVVGKTRLAQLTPEQRKALIQGEIQCPFYEPGPKVRKPRERNTAIFASKGVIRHRKSWAAVEQLYQMGLNDYQIGRALGLCASAVQWWRQSEGLPANCGVGHPPKERGSEKDENT